ncbi:hypothetical protein SPBRAN_1904 [uncultured Candidatus Thioglobus sp.]|nr:hypothetical protein SPBRAN_1904 [uncultured Candidatus Thioglobus sp.]
MSKKPTTPKQKDQEPHSVTHQAFSGPIPSPVVLEQYQKTLPSAPERILAMAEQQQTHENNAVEKALNGEIYLKKHGQFYGFLLVFLIALLSAYSLFFGYEKFAIIGMIFVAASLVKIFILGSKDHQ